MSHDRRCHTTAESDPRKHVRGATHSLTAVCSRNQKRQAYVFRGSKVWQKIMKLIDETHLPVSKMRQRRRSCALYRKLSGDDASMIRHFKPAQ